MELLGSSLAGRSCSLVPPDEDLARRLYPLVAGDDATWTYLFDEAPQDEASFVDIVRKKAADESLRTFMILDSKGDPRGFLAFMRVCEARGRVEIGHVVFSPSMRRTTMATESIYLLLAHAFDVGFDRVEWKCHWQNHASRRAAARFGFSFEGVWRGHLRIKGRLRDTAWFATTRSDWREGGVAAAFEQWLAPDNFGPLGDQLRALDCPKRDPYTLVLPERLPETQDELGAPLGALLSADPDGWSLPAPAEVLPKLPADAAVAASVCTLGGGGSSGGLDALSQVAQGSLLTAPGSGSGPSSASVVAIAVLNCDHNHRYVEIAAAGDMGAAGSLREAMVALAKAGYGRVALECVCEDAALAFAAAAGLLEESRFRCARREAPRTVVWFALTPP